MAFDASDVEFRIYQSIKIYLVDFKLSITLTKLMDFKIEKIMILPSFSRKMIKG